MTLILKEIKIPDDSYCFLENSDTVNVLKSLSKVNIFVGGNNSGKSLLLRKIFSKYGLEFIPSDDNLKNINNAISEIKEKYNDYCETHSFFPSTTIGQVVEPIIEEMSSIDFLVIGEDTNHYFNKLIDLISKLQRQSPQISQYNMSYKEMGELVLGIINESFENNDIVFEDLKLDYNTKNIYIPILRGLRSLNYSRAEEKNTDDTFFRDVYTKRTREDYFENNKSFNIFSGLQMYDVIHQLKNGDYNERETIKNFESYLSENFFDDEKVLLIPNIREHEIFIKIGNEIERKIYDLGDGIQSIIILTFPLFTNNIELPEKTNILVFIEEPEHLLHPSLQRKFMEIILDDERFSNFQFFFTTHSNHFLDITLDYNNISLFAFEKDLNSSGVEQSATFSISNPEHGDSTLLDMLGVRNSSVFMSNCHIIVEGITDAMYLKHYLDIYQDYMKNADVTFEKYKEDFHFSFIEVGGSNIKHFYEEDFDLERVYGNVFLVMDSDELNESEIAEIETTLKEKLSDDFHILECREIENLIDKGILVDILENDKKYRGYELRSFEYEDYKKKKLSLFIKTEAWNDVLDWNPIGNKRKFCKKVKLYIKTWEDLSPEAQEITEKIYEFIKTRNV